MISVPGKLFIFGEYSVMNGGEAILAAVKPEFQCGWSNTTRIHPASPAGKFLAENKTQVFAKVEEGLGAGFGSSTAELIAANEYLDQPWSFSRLWTWYHENCAPASGADLAVQEVSRKEGTGVYHFQLHDTAYRLNQIAVPTAIQMNFLLFQAPNSQKIPTYSDLENKKDTSVEISVADHFVKEWLSTFDPVLLTEWADYLAKVGFESLFAHQVRNAFQAIPGVTGAKGCGAGLNDVFIVNVDQSQIAPHTKQELFAVTEKFNLKALGSLRDHV